jgi:hypothetical protein
VTGAGSARVAFAVEDSFRTLPGTPTWTQPGENVSVGSASLENALQRARQPDDPRPDGSYAGNVEGAYNVSFEMTDTAFHDLIFPDGTGLASSAALAPSATWFIESQLPDGTTEQRFLSGAVVESVSISYNQGEAVTVDLTIIYADEPEVGGTYGDAPADGAIDQPTKDDIATFSGVSLDINGVAVEKLQSASLDISGMARFRRGQSRFAVDAVVGAYEPTLSVEAILSGDQNRTLAYGSSTATEPLDTIDESSGELSISNRNGTLVTYTLSGLQPNTFDYADLVSPDADVTDPTDFQVKDVTSA